MDPKHQVSLGYALVQRLAPALVLCACASAPAPEVEPPPPPKPTTHFVAPGGNNAWEGSRERPFETIAHALSTDVPKIVLLGGEFSEAEINIERSVSIEGEADRSSVLLGHVYVKAEEPRLVNLTVRRGLELYRSVGFSLESVQVFAGEGEDALSVISSRGTFSQLKLECGVETCLQVTTSTLTVNGLEATAISGTKRGLRVESSSVAIEGVTVIGASIMQVQASGASTLRLRKANLQGALGNALAALQASSLDAEDVQITNVAGFGLLFQASSVRFARSEISEARALTVGITGGDVKIEESSIEGGPEGAMSISNRLDNPASVTIVGGEIKHGSATGILVASGTLSVNGTRLIGQLEPGADGDAITVSGLGASINLENVSIESPAGYGVSITNDASGVVSANIRGPGAGGVFVEGAATDPVALRNVQVNGCQRGTGLVLFDTRATIENAEVSGCPEAGVLAGQQAEVELGSSTFSSNVQYGIAAFGGAQVRVQGTQVMGSKWAIFASCADGARIEDLGENQFKGPTGGCL